MGIATNPPCAGAESVYGNANNGEPAGAERFAWNMRANDPMNLIRVMPAEEFVALPCGARIPSP
jgi:hypothetical protein